MFGVSSWCHFSMITECRRWGLAPVSCWCEWPYKPRCAQLPGSCPFYRIPVASGRVAEWRGRIASCLGGHTAAGQCLRVEAAYTLGLERLNDRAREVWEHLEVGEGGSQALPGAAAVCAGNRVTCVCLRLEMCRVGVRRASPSHSSKVGFSFPLSENVISPLLLESFTGTKCLYFPFFQDYTS